MTLIPWNDSCSSQKVHQPYPCFLFSPSVVSFININKKSISLPSVHFAYVLYLPSTFEYFYCMMNPSCKTKRAKAPPQKKLESLKPYKIKVCDYKHLPRIGGDAC